MSPGFAVTLVVTVRAVSTGIPLVRAEYSDAQQYFLNDSVMGSLLHAVRPGGMLELPLIQVPEQPSKILKVRRPGAGTPTLLRSQELENCPAWPPCRVVANPRGCARNLSSTADVGSLRFENGSFE
jgi:hypothetical protein